MCKHFWSTRTLPEGKCAAFISCVMKLTFHDMTLRPGVIYDHNTFVIMSAQQKEMTITKRDYDGDGRCALCD